MKILAFPYFLRKRSFDLLPGIATLRTDTHHRADKKILPEEARLSASAAAAIAAFIGSFEG